MRMSVSGDPQSPCSLSPTSLICRLVMPCLWDFPKGHLFLFMARCGVRLLPATRVYSHSLGACSYRASLNPALGEVCPVWICSQASIRILLLTCPDTPEIRQQGYSVCAANIRTFVVPDRNRSPLSSACLTRCNFFLGFLGI